ncbi:MAG: thiamine pyrophosphate-binding protein [Acetobacteraceae bacterium]|nr:thiamine pyrophosphate-binding protein [Acetobacteraceae bacterium]
MPSRPIYAALAEAFAAEGTDTLFVLTGDGNMHWEVAMTDDQAVRSIHVRHEHCAVAMATAYAVATGRVGVASVTCGPGLTQIMTALATAAQARIPLVVFAGESPMHAAWYNQHIDQAPLVVGTGAHYIGGRSAVQVLNNVRDAFYIARTRRQPVVLGVPLDLQQQPIEAAPYAPSTDYLPRTGPMVPHPDDVARAAALLARASRIVIVGGRGALSPDGRAACEALADRTGALLASTLPARGLFDHDPRSLGIAGGFSHHVARTKFAQADLVIAVGASLTHHTVDGGSLFPNATVLQIDPEPQGLRQGRKGADVHLRADGREGVDALLRVLTPQPGAWPDDDLPSLLAGPADPAEFPPEPGAHDPRAVIAALDAAIPKDWEVVNASGHCSYFSAQMRGRSADHFLAIREFGAIGNGLSYAAGLAAARPGRPLVLIDGDGGLLMHVQELETIRRHGLTMLICVLNDGAFGSEIHKLRADGLSDHGATFGRGDLARVAQGFGLRGTVVTDLARIPELLVPRHSEFDGLRSGGLRRGSRSCSTRTAMDRAAPGCREIKPAFSSVSSIW